MEEITQKLVRSLFDYRDGFLYWKVNKNSRAKIGNKAGSLNKNGYYLIGINGKNIHLGYFTNELDAAKAYNKAAIKYHKEFACLNNV